VASLLAMGAPAAAPATAFLLLGAGALHVVTGGLPDEPACPGAGQLILPDGTKLTSLAGGLGADALAWLLRLQADLLAEAGLIGLASTELQQLLERQANAAPPAGLLCHPWPADHADGGEPAAAPLQFLGLSAATRLGDLARALHEAIGFGARQAFAMLGARPGLLRLAAPALVPACHPILAAAAALPVALAPWPEPALAGAAIAAAVALGLLPDWAELGATWLADQPAAIVPPTDPTLYDRRFATWQAAQPLLATLAAMIAAPAAE
jgi:erythritol kinase